MTQIPANQFWVAQYPHDTNDFDTKLRSPPRSFISVKKKREFFPEICRTVCPDVLQVKRYHDCYLKHKSVPINVRQHGFVVSKHGMLCTSFRSARVRQ